MATLMLKITEEEHSKIKTMAAFNKQSLKDFILKSIFLQKTPNKTTLKAVEELEAKRESLTKYNSFSELLEKENITNDKNH